MGGETDGTFGQSTVATCQNLVSGYISITIRANSLNKYIDIPPKLMKVCSALNLLCVFYVTENLSVW